jgi:epoxyqueuosine reductase QueG
MLPDDLLPGARSVVSYFIPFDPAIVEANARHREQVAEQWVTAYLETNQLLKRIAAELIASLNDSGIRAAAEPPTDNFDPRDLTSRWSHKSVAVIAGLGSYGLNHLLITPAGCAGRLGSLVTDAQLPPGSPLPGPLCLRDRGIDCLKCLSRCPVSALHPDGAIDKQACWQRCQQVAEQFSHLGLAEVCGKCATGPCALRAPDREDA